MHVLNSLLVAIAAFGATAIAASTPGTSSISSVTCGTTTYTQQQIEDATDEGCRLYDEGTQIGNSKYPHKFNNREGLVFTTSGPYQEFPIIKSGVYSGRAPGADRIVFDPNYKGDCVFVGAMTHTDAPTRNGFVECDIVESKTQPSAASSVSGLGMGGAAVLGLAAMAFQMIL